MKRNLLYLLAAISVFLISCADSPTTIVNEDLTFSPYDFPLKVGNSWTYEYIDTINRINKYFDYKIVDSENKDGYEKYFPKSALKNEDWYPEGEIIRKSDSLIVPFFGIYCKTPLKVGNSWGNPVSSTSEITITFDSSYVANAFSDYRLNGRIYKDVIFLKKRKYFKNNITHDRFAAEEHLFIAKNIGVILHSMQAINVDRNKDVVLYKKYTIKSYML